MAHRRVGNILQYLVCKMNVFVFVAKSQQFYSRTLDFKGEINKMARSRKIIKNDNGMLRARHLNPLLLICVSQNETLTGSQNWCGEGIVILSSPHNIWLRLFVIKQFAQLTLFPRVSKTSKANFGYRFAILREHFFKHRFFEDDELVILTLMKGDEAIKV